MDLFRHKTDKNIGMHEHHIDQFDLRLLEIIWGPQDGIFPADKKHRRIRILMIIIF